MNEIVYLILRDGEIDVAFSTHSEAVEYLALKFGESVIQVLNEMACDDPSESELALASFKAGYDGDSYELHKVDLNTPDGDVEIDGYIYDCDDIRDVLTCFEMED